MDEVEDEPLFRERVAGIDIGKTTIMVTIRVPSDTRRGRRQQETREFRAVRKDLLALADWLRCWGVTRIGMEATGDYWKPVYFLLEREGFDCVLYHASQVKALPGRPKTDKLDSVWLAKITERGNLPGSFVPPEDIRRLRTHTGLLLRQTASPPPPWRQPAPQQRPLHRRHRAETTHSRGPATAGPARARQRLPRRAPFADRLDVAEGDEVLGRAERRVERVVDAAEAEALRHLGIELRILVELEAQDAAGGHPVGIHGSPHAQRAIAGEHAIEALDACLFVLVIADSAGHAPLVRDVPGSFAESGVLIQPIAEVGVERGVYEAHRIRTQRKPGGRIEAIVPRRREILGKVDTPGRPRATQPSL